MGSGLCKTIIITLVLTLFPAKILFAADRAPQAISWSFLIIGLFGGLALFLYGMEKMSEGMKKSAGPPASHYKIGHYLVFPDQTYASKAVRFERKLELAMEGHRHFDLVRYGTAAPEVNAYIAKEKKYRTYFTGKSFTAGVSEYFPVPQSQIDLSKGTLKQNPGY